MRAITAVFALFIATLASAPAIAQQQLWDWQIWHQPAASEMAARIEWFDLYTLWFIVPITILVMVLMLIVIVRYNARANPNPSRTTHNTFIEVVWTVVPIIILIMIAIPSFDLLTRQIVPEEEPELTVKATGFQWYWGYEYQDGSEIAFDSLLIGREKYSDPEAAMAERAEYGKTDEAEYPYLLAVDNDLVLPVDTVVRVLITAADVIHAFAVPALGVKKDAVPGRINEVWFKADREGIFYGQCSELCGKDHAFMPIGIRIVSAQQYEAWKAAAADDIEAANRALMASIEAGRRSVEVAGN